MIYLGIFYKDNGRVMVQEFYKYEEMRKYIEKNKEKYLTYDIYMAKCINNKILTLWEE